MNEEISFISCKEIADWGSEKDANCIRLNKTGTKSDEDVRKLRLHWAHRVRDVKDVAFFKVQLIWLKEVTLGLLGRFQEEDTEDRISASDSCLKWMNKSAVTEPRKNSYRSGVKGEQCSEDLDLAWQNREVKAIYGSRYLHVPIPPTSTGSSFNVVYGSEAITSQRQALSRQTLLRQNVPRARAEGNHPCSSQQHISACRAWLNPSGCWLRSPSPGPAANVSAAGMSPEWARHLMKDSTGWWWPTTVHVVAAARGHLQHWHQFPAGVWSNHADRIKRCSIVWNWTRPLRSRNHVNHRLLSTHSLLTLCCCVTVGTVIWRGAF